MTTEHLPECVDAMIHDPMCVELNAFDNQYGYTTSCKCERLRAYAAKVRMETQLECRTTQQEVYDLIASAVADALAAIDELRNPPSLPPTTGRALKY